MNKLEDINIIKDYFELRDIQEDEKGVLLSIEDYFIFSHQNECFGKDIVGFIVYKDQIISNSTIMAKHTCIIAHHLIYMIEDLNTISSDFKIYVKEVN